MVINTVTRTLIDGDRSVVLQRLQCRMIEVLAVAYPEYVSDASMHRLMWPTGHTPADPNTVLRVTSSTLNHRLYAAGIDFPVRREWGRGYRLLRQVGVVSEEPALMVPDDMRALLRDLLGSHPDRVRAGRVLQVLG